VLEQCAVGAGLRSIYRPCVLKGIEEVKRRSVIWVIVLVLTAYVLGTVGIFRALMSRRIATVWDFYQLWYSARTLLLEHRDPYDPQVTLEMQQALYGRPALVSEGQPAFYYPVPVLLLVAPFALVPYPLAASAWLCLLLFAVTGAVGVVLWGLKWRAPTPGATVLVLWTLVLFPVLWSVILGQVAVLLLLPLNAGLAALLHKRDRLAGVCLAFSTFKPPLVYLLLPLLGVWALANRRWRYLVVFVGALTAWGVASWLLLPAWPARFLASVINYATISPFAAPLQILFEDWLGLPVRWLWTGVGILLVSGCLVLWLLARDESQQLAWATGATLIVSALIIPCVGLINQLILLWPALMVVKSLWFRRGWERIMSVAVLVAMVVVPWIVAAVIRIPPGVHRYEAEHAALAPFLPLLLGSAILVRWAMLWHTGGSRTDSGL
jgi:hypothetical protein